MYTCKVCSKEFLDRRKYAGHVSSHSRGENYSKTRRNPNKDYTKNINHICKYCSVSFETGQKLGYHISRCERNPNFESIDTNRRKKLSIASKSRTPELREQISKKVSATVREKVKNGTWHFSFSKTRCYDYKGIRLYGSWELKYAMYLDSKNIQWEQNKKRFPYVYEGKDRFYIPDFYLPKEDIYIEIKGYETEKDKAKWQYFKHTLIVLKYDDLRKLGIDV